MVATALLHPSKQRRVMARMPEQPGHEFRLRPLGNGSRATLIHTSTAQDFIAGLMTDLQAEDWELRLRTMRRRRVGQRDAVLELNQPIHRRFQLMLFEACCDQPGSPRLDPQKISGSGFVVRRVPEGAAQSQSREAWMKRGKAIDGWVRLPNVNADPQAVSAQSTHAANARLRDAVARRQGKPQAPQLETVHALYPAPPEVCAALGKTVLFGVLPVVSSETRDGLPAPINYRALSGDDRSGMVEHLSSYLKPRAGQDMPRAGQRLTADWNVLDAVTKAADARLASLGTFLFQLMHELDGLGNGRAARALMGKLAAIQLPVEQDYFGQTTRSISAADFVRSAGPILIGRQNNPAGVTMPLRWPSIDGSVGNGLIDAALDCLSERHAAVASPEGKFARDNARYVARGFIRVRGHVGCPDKLAWSIESEPFRILPWWDGAGPGTAISLPSIAQAKAVKPSVAFSMPPAIANLLRGDMKDLAEGKGSTAGPDIGWLCSFSIPFITICAFIVLSIFLALFDIIFRWLMFIKICIPIPKPPPPAGGGGG